MVFSDEALDVVSARIVALECATRLYERQNLVNPVSTVLSAARYFECYLVEGK